MGTKGPGNESSWNFRSWGTKVLHRDLSSLGTKGLGYEKSVIRSRCTFGNPTSHFSSILFIHDYDYLRYLGIKSTSTVTIQLKYQSADIRMSYGSGLIHGLNFSRVWSTMPLISSEKSVYPCRWWSLWTLEWCCLPDIQVAIAKIRLFRVTNVWKETINLPSDEWVLHFTR